MRTLTIVTVALAFAGAARANTYPTGMKLRNLVYKTDACLGHIIDRETGMTWDPTISYGFHHNPNDSYGLAQAQPGRKMERFGKDWLTNPFTQLRFARWYAQYRYGSTCLAWASWQRQGWW